jgi:hypothetical protein
MIYYTYCLFVLVRISSFAEQIGPDFNPLDTINIGRDTGYPKIFLSIPKSLQSNAGTAPLLSPLIFF